MGSLTNDDVKEDEQNDGSYRTFYVISYRIKMIEFCFCWLACIFANDIGFPTGYFRDVAGPLVYNLSCTFRMAYLSRPA